MTRESSQQSSRVVSIAFPVQEGAPTKQAPSTCGVGEPSRGVAVAVGVGDSPGEAGVWAGGVLVFCGATAGVSVTVGTRVEVEVGLAVAVCSVPELPPSPLQPATRNEAAMTKATPRRIHVIATAALAADPAAEPGINGPVTRCRCIWSPPRLPDRAASPVPEPRPRRQPRMSGTMMNNICCAVKRERPRQRAESPLGTLLRVPGDTNKATRRSRSSPDCAADRRRSRGARRRGTRAVAGGWSRPVA